MKLTNTSLSFSSSFCTPHCQAEQFLSATESVPNHAPRLEHAYDIWVSRREADGINYGLFFAGDNVEVDESGPLDFLPCEVPKTCIIL